MSKDLKKTLKNMGIDLSKYPKDKLDVILKLTDSITDPSKMNTQQIHQLQVLLGLKKGQTKKRVKIRVNDKCPCDSGKKYKKCCMRK